MKQTSTVAFCFAAVLLSSVSGAVHVFDFASHMPNNLAIMYADNAQKQQISLSFAG